MSKKSITFKSGIALFIGVTFAYFLWLTWKKLTDLFGDSDIVWYITGGILIIAAIGGYFSLDQIAKRFK